MEAPRLTPREVDVLLLAAQGLTQAQAAEALGISEQTVKNHATRAYRKFGVDGHVAAFRVLGWLRPPVERLASLHRHHA